MENHKIGRFSSFSCFSLFFNFIEFPIKCSTWKSQRIRWKNQNRWKSMIFYHFSYFIASLGFISAEISSKEPQKGLILIDFHLNLAIFFRKEILISFHFIRFAQIEAIKYRKWYVKWIKIDENLWFSIIFHLFPLDSLNFSLKSIQTTVKSWKFYLSDKAEACSPSCLNRFQAIYFIV